MAAAKWTAAGLLLLALLAPQVVGRTPEEWRSRRVYQLLTDRFARTNGDTSQCSDLSDYCGGTYRGIVSKLDYIEGMGFNAVRLCETQAQKAQLLFF